MIRVVTLWLPFLCVVSAGPATKPATQPRADWFRMTPDDFARTDAAQSPLPFPRPDDKLISAAILHETNRHRKEHGLPALRHMPKVDEAAIMHAEDMAEGGWFSHVNENDPKKREVIDRVKLLKLRPMFAGENIIMHHGLAYDHSLRHFKVEKDGRVYASHEENGEPIQPHTYQSFAQTVVQRWMDSPPHRENILSPHAKFLGSACRAGNADRDRLLHTYYAVQVFFAPM